MKRYAICFVTPALTLLIFGCGVQRPSHEGVYLMDDLVKMKEFVGSPGIPGYAYCLDLRPNKNLATVKFLESPDVYELRVEKSDNGDYLFKGPNGIRKAKVVAEVSNPGNYWIVHIHFEDSSPYSEKAKHMNIPYDGGKDPAWKTLDDCVQAQLEHLRIAEEQRYPMSEETEPEKGTK